MQTENSQNLLYAVNEKPPLWLCVVLGFQHVIVIYSEIIIFPFVVGHLAGADEAHIRFACFSAAVAACISTLLQTIRIRKYGSGYPIFMGSSAAYLACSVEAVKMGGFPLLATLSILVAPFEAVFAYFIRFLRHIITPAVGGVVLILIVISLLPLSVKEWVGSSGEPHFGSMQNLITGLVTMFVLLGIALFGSKRLRIWCPLIGLTIGFMTSAYLGLLNFKLFYESPLFGLPLGTWPGLTFDIKLDHLPVIAAMAIVTIINGVQAIGNSMAVQQVSERNFKKVDYDRIQGCMYADSAGNVVSGLLGTVPNETYCENISILGITGVASRHVAIAGALIMLFLAFSPKISALLIEMPQPVFGGFLMGLAAMMFPTGISLIATNSLNHQNGLLVGISLCIGMVAESGKFFPKTLPIALTIFTNSAVAAGGITAVILSLLLYLFRKRLFSFSLDASISQLTTLVEIINTQIRDLRLPSETLYKLELACEEVFIHIIEEAGSIGDVKKVFFKIEKEEKGLFVEINTFSKVFDIEHKINDIDHADINVLGIRLTILQKITSDLKHIYISGNTYISFRLPVAD